MSDSIHQFGPEHTIKLRLHAKRDEMWKVMRYYLEVDLGCDGRHRISRVVLDRDVDSVLDRERFLKFKAESLAQDIGKLFAPMIQEMLEKCSP